MKLKYIIALLISTCLLSSSFADNTKSEMPICPNAKSFKTIAFDEIQKGDTAGVWTFVKNGTWKFSLMIDAPTKDAAIKKAKLALAHLRKMRGPEKVGEVWVCDYQSNYAMSAVATSQK